LLTTFLPLIPSCCDLLRGETSGELTGVFPTFLPIAALINLCLSNGEPAGRIGFKNGFSKRIATQDINLECVAFTPVGSFDITKTTSGERLGGLRPLHQLPTSSKRSGIYSFVGGVSISCGYLFFQCYRVCSLSIHVNKLRL